MKTVTQMFKTMFTKVSRASEQSAAHSAPVLESMEGRVLMSATLVMSSTSGICVPAEQRPTESLSLNYTKIEYKYVG
jgi:hypothetical protein